MKKDKLIYIEKRKLIDLCFLDYIFIFFKVNTYIISLLLKKYKKM
jgi:hypothetical protein